MRHFLLLLLLNVATSLLPALDIGATAPSLADVIWVKGEAPVIPGKITVVEFWATWCGPCKKTIPHLTALQQRYREAIQVVGLSDEDGPTVKPFVEKLDEQMAYRVGLAGKATYQAYMAGIEGIPYAFLLDAQGTVAWQGHPLALDEPLAQLVAGTLDLEKAKALIKATKELDALIQGDHPDVDKAIAKCDGILALDPVHEQALRVRIALGGFSHRPELIRETLARIPLAKLNANLANGLAWERAIDETLVNRHLDLALAIIKRALELEPGNAAYLDTWARVLYGLVRIDEAVAAQEQAVQREPQDRGLALTLDFYRQVQRWRQTPTPSPAPDQGAVP
jgi:thiol-disulfide isomerase/thioredoxin